MKCRIAALLMLFAGLPPQLAMVAQAQTAQAAAAMNTSAVDSQLNPNEAGPTLTGVRHPLYRLHKSDVVDVKFTFSPEFDQTITPPPDVFVALKGLGELFAEGLMVSELRDSVDAMGAGVCLLASDVPENCEVIEDTGFVYKRGDVHDLQRMLSLLLSDVRLREIAGGSAQQRVRQHYLWEKVEKEIAAVYGDLMSPATTPRRSAASSMH